MATREELKSELLQIVALAIAGPHSLRLTFSDGNVGVWNGHPHFSTHPTVITTPLLQPAEFAKAFIESGALAWPNGLELGPRALHEGLAEAGLLTRQTA